MLEMYSVRPGIKKTLQNATPLSLFDRFTWKIAQRDLLRVQKIWWERIGETLFFMLFVAMKPAKLAIFANFWNFNVLRIAKKAKIQKRATIKS